MSARDAAASNGGISVLGALGVLFVGLKLAGVIDWSWWLVTLPFWGGFALVMIVLVAVLVVAVLKRARKL